MKFSTTEICVIGGGPAGAAAAYRLARLGHSVILVERRIRPRLRAIESFPPSIIPLLDFLDLSCSVEECLRLRAGMTAIRWQDTTPQFWTEDESLPFLVDRNQFDEALLTAAGETGVHILRPVVASRPRSTGEGWEIEVIGRDGGHTIQAAFLMFASGKNSAFARPRQPLSPATLALIGHWRNCQTNEPVMCVDVGRDFWCWGCRLPDGTGHTIAFVDRDGRLLGEQSDSGTLWSRWLSQAPLLAKSMNGEHVGRVSTYDATAYQADSFASARWVAIGDAAVTFDPLSSQGVQTALSTALQGSLVAHTILTVPANVAAAVEFYTARLAELVTRHVRQARRLYAQQGLYPRADFWSRRGPLAEPPPIESEDISRQRHTGENLMVPLRYCVADGGRIVDTPAVKGDIISLQPSLVHPSLDRPLTYVDGVPIAPLLSAFGKEGSLVLDIINRFSQGYERSIYEQVIRLLIEKGVLTPAPHW